MPMRNEPRHRQCKPRLWHRRVLQMHQPSSNQQPSTPAGTTICRVYCHIPATASSHPHPRGLSTTTRLGPLVYHSSPALLPLLYRSSTAALPLFYRSSTTRGVYHLRGLLPHPHQPSQPSQQLQAIDSNSWRGTAITHMRPQYRGCCRTRTTGLPGCLLGAHVCASVRPTASCTTSQDSSEQMMSRRH